MNEAALYIVKGCRCSSSSSNSSSSSMSANLGISQSFNDLVLTIVAGVLRTLPACRITPRPCRLAGGPKREILIANMY